MKFDNSIDKILCSKAKMKVLEYLFHHQASMSESELSKILKLSHMTINRVMKELHDLNLVSVERIGNANVWAPNKESYAYKALSEVIEKKTSIPTPIEHLKQTINEYIPKGLVKKIILFGSIAVGNSKTISDIDLFILVESEKESEKLSPLIDKLSNICLDLYGNRLSPYILTEVELKNKQKLGLLKEIEKGILIS